MVPASSAVEDGGDRSGPDPVFVTLGPGIEAGVEAFGDGVEAKDADVVREERVHPTMKVPALPIGGNLEAGDLPEGVDAGIRPAGPRDRDSLAKQPGQDFL